MSSHGRAGWSAFLACAATLGLAACNGGPASSPPHDQATNEGGRVASAPYGGGSGANDSGATRASYAPDPRRERVPLVEGKPMWAANRLHTAQENAQYQFERDGTDFGAGSVEDFVSKVHAFVDKPPADVLTLTRANGDRLLYDQHGNVFAVVTKDGAPRTMFKPRDGEAYWEVQKQRVAAEANGSSDSYRANGDRSYGRKGSGAGGSDDQG